MSARYNTIGGKADIAIPCMGGPAELGPIGARVIRAGLFPHQRLLPKPLVLGRLFGFWRAGKGAGHLAVWS